MTFEHLPLPRPAIAWKSPWRQVEAGEQRGLQGELLAELSPAHPLWGCDPVVFGRSDAADDVLVMIKDGRFAIVHLVWHGHVDQFPADFPGTLFFANLAELVAALDSGEWA